jgi:energy-coupling factor transport system ATP-binding protein
LTIKEGLRFSRPWFAEHSVAALRRSKPQPARNGEPSIRARGVKVRFGQQEALRGIDLELWPGEIVVLMGRNGAGKTTLLRSLVRLVRPHAGVIEVAGQNIAGQQVADICRKVGYLPQDPNTLLFAESVEQELKVTLRNHRMDAEERKSAALLQRLKLHDKMNAYPRDLSVGERQRVALAAISVTQPGALLLDEPTRGLDYAAKQELERMLREWRDEGMAILVVTHDVELAAAIADRVILMSQGEIIAEGPPADVLATSPLFAPQIARLFPESGWLTVEDVLGANGRCQD